MDCRQDHFMWSLLGSLQSKHQLWLKWPSYMFAGGKCGRRSRCSSCLSQCHRALLYWWACPVSSCVLQDVPCCILRCLLLYAALIVVSHVAVSFLLYVLLRLGDTSSSQRRMFLDQKVRCLLHLVGPRADFQIWWSFVMPLFLRCVGWCSTEALVWIKERNFGSSARPRFSPSTTDIKAKAGITLLLNLQVSKRSWFRDSWSYFHWLRCYTHKTFLERSMECQSIHRYDEKCLQVCRTTVATSIFSSLGGPFHWSGKKASCHSIALVSTSLMCFQYGFTEPCFQARPDGRFVEI